MKMPVIRLRGRWWIAVGILSLLCSPLVSLRSQPVTMDFSFTNLFGFGPSLPWHEDGFTVASLTRSSFPVPFPGTSNPQVTSGKLSPYGGYLQFAGGGTNFVTALITNDVRLSFDLLSLSVVGLNMAATNYARITSSAGGTYDLFGTPGGTTLSFTGSQWENLSYLLIEFQAPLTRLSPIIPRQLLQLDNIVLRPVEVPEPAGLGVAVLVCLGAIRWRTWRRNHSVTSQDCADAG